MAPPWGLTFFSSMPSSFIHASGTDAKASLHSKTPIWSIVRPARFRAFWVAGMGAVSIGMGGAPARTAVWTRTIGVRPSSAARSLVMTSSAAEPSLICEALPAVTTPSSLNGVLRLPSFSTVPPRRMPSSALKTVPSGRVIGTIWPVNRPSSCAVAALSWLDRANSSSWLRDSPQVAAMSSAPSPWLGKSAP